MLVRPHELFAKAFNMQYALGAFNTSNLELTQAIIRAAEKTKSPVIVQTSTGAIEYAGVNTIAGIVRSLAEEYSVPVVLHLDHGHSFEEIKVCIEAGYTSVMIDASAKKFEENVRITNEVVNYAHERGVWVEAEIGALLGAEGAKGLGGMRTPDDMLTGADEARKLVEATGVDSLAVAVGTIHGAFTGQEYIRFERLVEIENLLTTTPLVLHGASGLASKHLEEASATNVCKVNIDTELRIAFEEAVGEYMKTSHEKVDPREMLGLARDAVQAVAEEKIKVFGSVGKA